MPERTDQQPPSPKPAAWSAQGPEALSGWRTFWLLGLLIAGFALIIGLQTWFSALIEDLDAQSANERVRLFVGEEISRGIHGLERDFYRLGTTSGAKAQRLVQNRLVADLDKLRHDILVLRQGGSVRQAVDLNLLGQDQMIREVHYQPAHEASAYVLELIELTPWLDEIQGKLAQLLAQLHRRDAHLAARDAGGMLAETDAINLFLKDIPPLFLRLGENANRLLYDSQNRQAGLEAQLARQKRQLEHTKHALILLVVLAIVVPGALVLRQIDAANRKLRRTWEEMRLAKDEAERASRTKSEFLSRMSHELRTPLNAILGFGQLLELEVQDKEQADNVQEILHAGNHLLELINEVLDLARIEAGRLTLSREPVALMPLIEESLTLVRPLAEARGIRVTDFGRDCGVHVWADRVRLKQVMLNLLSNAVKYNHEGGSLGIACLFDGEAVQIRVSDTGPGLAPEQQTRLFQAFERLDADKAAIEGTGIGLALSKRLIELMHGEIGVESTPGAGSTFWIRLPTAEATREAAAEADATDAGAAPRAAGQKRREVLCIEDNPANLRLIERVLARRDDIRLRSASDPRLGLELAAAYRPDLILLDINLPHMDGWDVMQCLRENELTRDIPVVAVSANAMPGDLARGRAAGCVAYLTKPLEVERLLDVVDEVFSAGTAAPGD